MARLGKYELIGRIAVGGMAEIYLARELGLAGFERNVIVKRVLPELARDPSFVEMFLDEARLAARLAHPKVAHIYELGQDEGTYFLAMEYIPGCDLESLLAAQGGPLPLAEALHVTCEMLEGLHYAHSLRASDGSPLNLVHRDVAPKNVLISIGGDVKIVDFGIAKARSRATVTAPGLVKGTFGYMSPEQASGHPVDHRTDVFATGATLYRLTTGHMPYRGELLELVDVVRSGGFRPPEEVRPDLPMEIRDVIVRAMASDADQRYATASAMRRDLVAAMRACDLQSDSDALGRLVGMLLPELPGQIQEWLATGRGEPVASPESDRSERQNVEAASSARAEAPRQRSHPDEPTRAIQEGEPVDETETIEAEAETLLQEEEQWDDATITEFVPPHFEMPQRAELTRGLLELQEGTGNFEDSGLLGLDLPPSVAEVLDPARPEYTEESRPDHDIEEQTKVLTPDHLSSEDIGGGRGNR